MSILDNVAEVGSYADGLLWGFSYHAVGDSRTRETHLAQHGVCASVDDPFWNEWTPPNGYNCRCWLISEWEEPSSYKQPRRDLHPDPGFAFNPTNNVSGRVPQQKKQEPPKPEVNTQSESVVKPDELGKDDAASEKNFEKKGKNIQKPVTSSKKKRYNNMGVSKSTVKPNAPRSPESPIPDEQEGTIIPTADGKFLAVHGPMVKTTRTKEEAEKAIRDAGGKVLEEKPEIKSDNNPEDRKEQENNNSKRGITEQEVQKALNIFHRQNRVNHDKTLVLSLLPDGSLVVKDGEIIVATIERTESEGLQLSANKRFYAVVNKIAEIYSSLLTFFENVSERYKNADIVVANDIEQEITIEQKSFLPMNGKKKGWMIGNTDNDTIDEKKTFDELRNLGLNLIRINTSNKDRVCTSDTWIMRGWRIKKLELKNLTTDRYGTIRKHISHAIEQGCQLLFLDMRKSGITIDKLSDFINEYKRRRIPSEIPIDIEIWLTEDGKIVRYSRRKDK